MKTKQRGFTLIVAMTVLMVLSLIVIASIEQAQWVKRSQYYVWLRIKMQDRLWRQLALAEAQLLQRAAKVQCFAPYSVSNDYFFVTNSPWPTTACTYTVADEQIQVVYESILAQPCAQIKGNMQAGVNFFRISVRSQLKTSGQRGEVQTVEAMPFLGDKNTEQLGNNINCTEYTIYEAGRQSWLLQ